MSRHRMIPRSLRPRSPLMGVASVTLAAYVGLLLFSPPLSARTETGKKKTATFCVQPACAGVVRLVASR